MCSNYQTFLYFATWYLAFNLLKTFDDSNNLIVSIEVNAIASLFSYYSFLLCVVNSLYRLEPEIFMHAVFVTYFPFTTLYKVLRLSWLYDYLNSHNYSKLRVF